MPGESCENVNSALDRRISVTSEKSVQRERLRELIFPSNYDLLRHLQYATHFPIPLVSDPACVPGGAAQGAYRREARAPQRAGPRGPCLGAPGRLRWPLCDVESGELPGRVRV